MGMDGLGSLDGSWFTGVMSSFCAFYGSNVREGKSKSYTATFAQKERRKTPATKKGERKGKKRKGANIKPIISFRNIQPSSNNRRNLVRTGIKVIADGGGRRAAVVAGAGVRDDGVSAAADDDIAVRCKEQPPGQHI